MKKQFQSKSVPRGTRTIWRYLGALFLLFTFAIGNVWAANEVVVIGSQSSGALTIATNTHSVAGISGGTNTGSIANASDSQSASGGSKMGGTSEIGSKLDTKGKQHIRFTVAAGETVRFYYYQTGGSNKSSTFATSDFSQSSAYYHAAAEYVAASKNALYFVDFKFDDAGTYAISLTTGQSVYMAALKFTAGSTPPADSYTVKYMDGTTELGTESVEVGSKPTASSINKNKDFYTFEAWQLSEVDKSLTDDSWKSVAKDAIVTLTARYSGPNYFTTSVDFETGGASAVSGIASKNIVASAAGEYDGGKESENWAYKGWKIKSNGATVKVFVQAGKKLTYKFGYLDATGHVNITNDATTYNVTGASKVQDNPLKYTTYSWVKAYDAVYTFTTGNSSAAVIKALTVQDTYTATRVDGKSDAAGTDANVLETTLPTPTAISGWTFTGWTANEDVKAGEDTKTAGTVLAAGTYTLLANTTFTAQWAEASSTYDVTYTSAHGTAPDAENAASVVLAELSETGWAHKGWTANVDVTVDAATVDAGTLIANGKTVVLGGDVTFTAVWKEIFTVTFDAKGGSSVAPVDVEDGATLAAAPADPTKDDYIFLGWSETDGGDVVADITAITISDDKTFYAKWKLDVQVSEIVFSNSFKGWINGSTVTAFYMEGESAPTVASYAGKNLKAEGGVVISGDKIIATATDDSEIEFDLTMTEVTPLTTTGAKQTFDGSETYVKSAYGWKWHETDASKQKGWAFQKLANDGRIAKGLTREYFFFGPAESATFTWKVAKKNDGDPAVAYVYVDGELANTVTSKTDPVVVPLKNTKSIVAFESAQTNGDCGLMDVTLAPWVPVTAVALKEGEDPISSKTIWESTSFTLTAEVTPDDASNKTITWTSSNDAVATVVNGVVTGVAANATPVTITASTVDGVTATCAVTVTTAPEPSADPVITEQPASANYYEGATIAALKVVATGATLSYQWYLGSEAIEGAIADTYQPEVSAIGSYVYHCVVTNTEVGNLPTSLATNNATITIEEDPAAIKLVGATGAINTTDFITGVATGTVNFDEADHNCAVFGNANITDITSCQYLAGMVQYNARTNKTKVKLDFYSTSGGKKAYLFKMVEGGNVETIEIDMPTAGRYTTEYYTFNSESNRSIYVGVSDRSRVNLLQMKVIDDGATTLKRFGEADYSLNLNKSRLLAPTDATVNFEGMTVTPASHNKVNYSTYLALKSDRDPISFTIAAPVTMTVVNASSNKYYVSTSTTDLGDEYGNGSNDFDLTAGTWYIVPKSTSAVQLTNIAFAAPYCQLAISGQPETNTNFGAGNLTATVVAASTTEGAALAYQWYNASDDSEVVGANEATLTTTTPGEYYVVVTASKAGYQNKVVQSNTIELGYRDLTIATLSALSYGGNAIALEADKYEYRVDLAENTTEVPALAATATQATYGATAVPTDATEFISYEAISTVLVTAEDGTTTQTYTVHFYVDHMLSQVNVTGTTTWNWINAAEGTVTIKVTDSTEPIKKNEEGLMANVRVDDNKPTNDATFNSQALLFYGENVRAKDGGRWYASVGHIKFTTTVAGMVEVEYSDNGTNNRRVKINNALSESSASKTDVKIFAAYMPAGEITIMGVNENDTEENRYVRISKIRFVETADAEPSLARDDDWLAYGELGTICIPQGAVAVGADIYELVGKEPQYGKIVFETVEHMKPGKPYLFQAKGDRIDFILTDETPATEPDNSKAMKGTFEQLYLTDLENVYYFADHALWSCVDLTQLDVPANRAYVKMDEVQELSNPNPAPGRRRVVLGVHGEQVVTGVENLNASEQPVKLLINGQIFILRGEKLFDVTGKLVK